MINYIIDLLKHNDCVIVPGLGGFISNYSTAEIDLGNNLLRPPSKKTAFNKVLRENDGLLQTYVAKKEKTSQRLALKKIEQFVQDVNKELETYKSYSFEQLGKLILNSEDKIEFYPLKSIDISLFSYGLHSIAIQPIERLKQLESPIEPILQTVAVNKNSNVIYPQWFFRVAAVVAVLFLISTLFYNINTGNYKTNESSFIPIANEHAEEMEMDVIPEGKSFSSAKIENVLDQVLNKDYTLVEEEVEEIVEYSEIKEEKKAVAPIYKNQNNYNPKVMNGDFFIIVGSFSDSYNADKHAVSLERKGFNSVTLPGPSGFTRVGISFVYSDNSPSKALSQVRKEVNNQAWILEY